MTVDAARAGQVLGEAFHDDPLFTWALPDEERRAKALPRLFTGSVRHCERYGGVVTRGDGAAVACWTGPDHVTISVPDAVRVGLATAPFWLGLGASVRLQKHEDPVDLEMETIIRPDDAYLMAVGTTRAARGTGLGRACVEAVLDAARDAGYTAVALRTENPDNVGLYEHLGFHVIDSWTVDSSGLEVWAMRHSLPQPSPAPGDEAAETAPPPLPPGDQAPSAPPSAPPPSPSAPPPPPPPAG